MEIYHVYAKFIFTTVRSCSCFGVRFEKGDDKFVEDGVGWQREYNGGGVVFLFIMLSVNNRKRGTRIDDNMGSGCIL